VEQLAAAAAAAPARHHHFGSPARSPLPPEQLLARRWVQLLWLVQQRRLEAVASALAVHVVSVP
jgi:hypothetical protein